MENRVCIARAMDDGTVLVTDVNGSMIDRINVGKKVTSVSTNGMTVTTVSESMGCSPVTDVWDCSSGYASHVNSFTA